MTTVTAKPTGGDVDDVGRQLEAAFTAMKAAVLDEQPVVVVVADGDLLGQGDPCDAALAGGLLGMVRTLAIEGVKPGWQVNLVSTREGTEELCAQVCEQLAAIGGLSGQTLRLGTDHLGKVAP